ncbi:MAG: hypothetical protein QF464_04570, partial [Myxococcota bacterium]|nr:hypothetical protein [Myxococcota bacterium]
SLFACEVAAGCAADDEACIGEHCAVEYAACLAESQGAASCWDTMTCQVECSDEDEACQPQCFDGATLETQALLVAAKLCTDAHCPEGAEPEACAVAWAAHCAEPWHACLFPTQGASDCATAGDCLDVCAADDWPCQQACWTGASLDAQVTLIPAIMCLSAMCRLDELGAVEKKACDQQAWVTAPCAPYANLCDWGTICGDCDDGVVCTTDSCDAASGLCLHETLAVGTACDDGDPCTLEGACDVDGACVTAQKCQGEESCVDGVCVPPPLEACPEVIVCVDACAPDDLEACTEACVQSATAAAQEEASALLGCMADNGCGLSDQACLSEHCASAQAACVLEGQGDISCWDIHACHRECALEESCQIPCMEQGTTEAQGSYAAMSLCAEAYCPEGADPETCAAGWIANCLDEVLTCFFEETGPNDCATLGPCFDECPDGDVDCEAGCWSESTAEAQSILMEGVLCVSAYCSVAEMDEDTLATCQGDAWDNECVSYGNACMWGNPCGNCDDGNLCTIDSCDGATLSCVHDVAAPGTLCDDADVCSVGDVCGPDGECLAGEAANCEDFNVCTTDSCDWLEGCVHEADQSGQPCSDGDPTTFEEVCDGAVCAATPCDPPCGDGLNCVGGACAACTSLDVYEPDQGADAPDGPLITLGTSMERSLCPATESDFFVLQVDAGAPALTLGVTLPDGASEGLQLSIAQVDPYEVIGGWELGDDTYAVRADITLSPESTYVVTLSHLDPSATGLDSYTLHVLPCASPTEVCDGQDNDCDGEVDEVDDDPTVGCDDGDDCTTDLCDGGTCATEPVVVPGCPACVTTMAPLAAATLASTPVGDAVYRGGMAYVATEVGVSAYTLEGLQAGGVVLAENTNFSVPSPRLARRHSHLFVASGTTLKGYITESPPNELVLFWELDLDSAAVDLAQRGDALAVLEDDKLTIYDVGGPGEPGLLGTVELPGGAGALDFNGQERIVVLNDGATAQELLFYELSTLPDITSLAEPMALQEGGVFDVKVAKSVAYAISAAAVERVSLKNDTLTSDQSFSPSLNLTGGEVNHGELYLVGQDLESGQGAVEVVDIAEHPEPMASSAVYSLGAAVMPLGLGLRLDHAYVTTSEGIHVLTLGCVEDCGTTDDEDGDGLA